MFCFTPGVNGNSKKNGFLICILICIVVSITIYFIEFYAELYAGQHKNSLFYNKS